jgi:hypothetical protein
VAAVNRRTLLIVFCLLASFTAHSPAAEPLAFRGALGFAAHVTGGRGQEVRHVTTLDDKGPGSLREAVSSGNAVIVFDVSGTIHLDKILSIPSNITLAGQTSPGMGIAIVGHEVSMSGSHNIICRYLRLRQGLAYREDKKYALGMYKCRDVIVDHCSIEFGRWDTIGMTGSERITIQNCIIGPGIAPQSFGCLCESDEVTFARNLWMENQSRNPKAKGKIQFLNNLVYAWGSNGFVGGHSAAEHSVDLVGNYFIAGRKSASKAASQFKATDHVYAKDNFADLTPDGMLNGKEMDADDFAGATLTKKPWSPITDDVLPAEQLLDYIRVNVGCAKMRDGLDDHLLGDLLSFGTRGGAIKDPAELGSFNLVSTGELPKDSDHDGIPDTWEAKHGLNPLKPDDANQPRPDGTCPLDDYLDDAADAR